MIGDIMLDVDNPCFWQADKTNTEKIYTWTATKRFKCCIGLSTHIDGSTSKAYSLRLRVRYDTLLGVWKIVTAYPV